MTPFIVPHRALDPAFLDALEELANDSTGNCGITTSNTVRYRLAIKTYCEWKQTV